MPAMKKKEGRKGLNLQMPPEDAVAKLCISFFKQKHPQEGRSIK